MAKKKAEKVSKKKKFPGAKRAPGTSPGTLNVDASAPAPIVHIIAYGPDTLDERTITDLAELDGLKSDVVWVDVAGLGDAAVLTQLAERFGLHPLAMEDVVNTHQRPKFEAYADHYFFVARMLDHVGNLDIEQVSLFCGKGFVLTFQEKPGDSFEPVRERLRRTRGSIRNVGADYLAYALLDAIVDHMFPVLEVYGDHLELLEEDIFLSGGGEPIVRRLMHYRQELLELRRSTWPMRDAINALMREEAEYFDPATRVYLRDCLDHVLRVIDLVESYREYVSSLMDINLSVTSAKLNEVMKVLTIIATIFIPLGFVAGLYGMNFDTSSPWNMPELGWAFGYPFALGMMTTIAVGLLAFFKRKGWL